MSTQTMTLLDSINDKIVSLQSLNIKNKLIFYRLLATMSNAWIWLVKAVSILEAQEKNPVLKKILVEFVKKLKSWKKLSDAMEDFPSSFAYAEVWIVRSW